MSVVVLIARILLSGVFTLSGVTKLVDRPGTRQAVLAFGVPAQLAGTGSVLLPAAELGVAVALLPSATAWWGGVGALTLLAAFSASIAVNLARGQRPDCHCFGQVHSAPISRSLLVRNAVLAVPALLVVLAA